MKNLYYRLEWFLLVIGVLGASTELTLHKNALLSASRQDWPAFALVTGLLLIGIAAHKDNVFDAGGVLVARLARNPLSFLLLSGALVGVVSVILNLDTAVVFTTPLLIRAARSLKYNELPVVYLCVFMANGSSLLLPGSNLTNLIILKQEHISTTTFAVHMFPAWIVVCATILILFAIFAHMRLFDQSLGREVKKSAEENDPHKGASLLSPSHDLAKLHFGPGTIGIIVAITTILVLPESSAAAAVLGYGILISIPSWSRRKNNDKTSPFTNINLRTLGGLFGVATAFGAIGRTWNFPSTLLEHISSWAVGGVATLGSVVFNNLPAASIWAAHRPFHPYELLIGLNLGPNLAVTGSLSALLWFEAARLEDSRPSLIFYSKLGLVVVPISVFLALSAVIALH